MEYGGGAERVELTVDMFSDPFAALFLECSIWFGTL